MPSYRLLIQRFPYGGREDTETVDWLMKTYHQAKNDRRFSEVRSAWLNDTPITMTRNRALLSAKASGFDFMLMVDSDMSPDVELLGGDPTAVPFFDCAVEYALKSPKPCVIAAPYVGPPPLENMYVFKWTNRGNTLHPQASNARLEQFTREEAAVLAGIQPVAALPTGLLLIDLRALDELPHPWTYYEYKDSGPDECPACHERTRGPEAEKASTEDVTLTRDLGLLGVPILCAWSSWAGHNKRYVARKPRPYTTDIVANKMRHAIGRRVLAGEQMIDVQPPAWLAAQERFDAGFTAAAERLEFDPPPAAHAGGTGNPELDALMATRERNGWPDGSRWDRPSLDLTAKIVGEVAAGQTPPPNGVTLNTADHRVRLSPMFAETVPPPQAVELPVVSQDPLTVRLSNGEEHVVTQPAADYSRPWEQHIPAAVGPALTPADLLAGVPLG